MIRRAIYSDSLVDLEGAIRAGADIDALDDRGFAPLHLAVMSGMFDGAAVLISHGADVNARTASGNTCLGLAICSANPDMVSLLLLNGADNQLKVHGCTPSELVETCVTEADASEINDRFRRLNTIRHFLEKATEARGAA